MLRALNRHVERVFGPSRKFTKASRRLAIDIEPDGRPSGHAPQAKPSSARSTALFLSYRFRSPTTVNPPSFARECTPLGDAGPDGLCASLGRSLVSPVSAGCQVMVD